jgi:DNA-binding NarL/FixJ family response regulator
MLNSFSGISVAGEAANASEVLAMIETTEAEILTLDLTMPGVTGVSLIEAVHIAKPTLPILILSMHDEASLVRQSLQSGAAGYITKNTPPDILVTALRALSSGGTFIDPAIAKTLAFDYGRSAVRDSAAILSPRELQILRLMVEQGMTLVAIAHELQLSAKTVTAHKTNIMAKLGVSTNVELIRFAIDHRLVD